MNTHETIIYGGAFNPPTKAHEAILQGCVDYADEHDADIWVLPSGDRADKTIPTEYSQRLTLVQAMVKSINARQVVINTVTTELKRDAYVETIDTVRELQDLYPERNFRWVYGADSTVSMHTWREGDWLLDNLAMLVIDREGYDINPLAKRAIGMTLSELKSVWGMSSSEVRLRLENGEPIDTLVSTEVREILLASVER